MTLSERPEPGRPERDLRKTRIVSPVEENITLCPRANKGMYSVTHPLMDLRMLGWVDIDFES